MGTFCLTFFMVCISTALLVKLQSENAGTYVHFVFILIFTKVLAKSVFIGWFSNGHETRLSKYLTILIYRDVLKANIDIRKE